MKILLIGDSIRIGYQELVRQKLAGRGEVLSPPANCGHSMMHRDNFAAWYLAQPADVIHFNCGIWDSVGPPGDPAPRFTVSAYARNLRIIVRRLRAETKSRLIFATTTPMLVPRDASPKENCRLYPLVQRLNAAAVRVMSARGVEVNDLCAAILAAGVNECLSEDKVHMSPRGNEVLAEAVVRFILG